MTDLVSLTLLSRSKANLQMMIFIFLELVAGYILDLHGYIIVTGLRHVKCIFSSPVRKLRELLLSRWPWRGCGHWCHTLKIYVKVFLCYGQGTVRRAILYGDRTCQP